MSSAQLTVVPHVNGAGDHTARQGRTDHPIIPHKRLNDFDAHFEIDLAVTIESHMRPGLGIEVARQKFHTSPHCCGTTVDRSVFFTRLRMTAVRMGSTWR